MAWDNGPRPSADSATQAVRGPPKVNGDVPPPGPPGFPGQTAASAYSAITFGADYPGTKFNYKQGSQFPATMQCGGPYGPDSTHCDTVLKPSPLA